MRSQGVLSEDAMRRLLSLAEDARKREIARYEAIVRRLRDQSPRAYFADGSQVEVCPRDFEELDSSDRAAVFGYEPMQHAWVEECPGNPHKLRVKRGAIEYELDMPTSWDPHPELREAPKGGTILP